MLQGVCRLETHEQPYVIMQNMYFMSAGDIAYELGWMLIGVLRVTLSGHITCAVNEGEIIGLFHTGIRQPAQIGVYSLND